MSLFDARCRDAGGLPLSTLKGFEFTPDKMQDAVRAFLFHCPTIEDAIHSLEQLKKHQSAMFFGRNQARRAG